MATKEKKNAKQTSATQTRHRTLANETAYIAGYPSKLFIYKLDASPYWWVRYYIGGKTVRKSTKQTSKQKAIAFAKEFYDTITYNYRRGNASVVSPTNFEVCAKELLEAEKAKCTRGQLTKVTYDNTRYRFDKFILPHFRSKDVQQIDYYALEKYLNKMSEQGLSSSTISAYMRLTRKVLVYAARRKLIASVPEFPKLKVEEKARGWFTTKEYRKIWGACKRYAGTTIEVRKWVDEEGNKRTQYINTNAKRGRKGELMRKVEMTEDLRRLVVFMTNSYIRPTDIKFMQHKHVDVVRGKNTYLRLRLPPTKGHSDPITTMPKAVATYLKLKEHHQAIHGKVRDDDYVFLPQYKNRDYALKQFQRQFEIIMWDTKLGKGTGDEERSLYSLRHTAIMYRLIFGDSVNTLALARNARTSVEMVDRFYAKPLTGEMSIEMLQSRKRKRKYFDGEG
jgi:integrase